MLDLPANDRLDTSYCEYHALYNMSAIASYSVMMASSSGLTSLANRGGNHVLCNMLCHLDHGNNSNRYSE